MNAHEFFGDNLYQGFVANQRNIMTMMIARQIFNGYKQALEKDGIDVFAREGAKSFKFSNKKTLPKQVRHGYVTRDDDNDIRFCVYSNASLPVLAASYAIREGILSPKKYEEKINFRWGRSFDSNSPLWSKMFLFYYADMINNLRDVDTAISCLLGDFYEVMPCETELSTFNRPFQAVRRPFLNLLITYKSLFQIEWADAKDYPSGLKIDLPIFLVDRVGDLLDCRDNIYKHSLVYRPFVVPNEVIKIINNFDFIPYDLYVDLMDKMKAVAEPVFNEHYALWNKNNGI